MKRVLIISPHFPPINAPDHQRVRMVLPYLKEAGWEAEVVAVDADWVSAPQDESLSLTVPDEITVHRVRGIRPSWTRPLGFDNLAWRNYRAVSTVASRLLASGRFNLVFFSTTQMALIALGPEWKRKFGIPFVLDIQDPIVNEFYERTGMSPPGGKWKYRWAQSRARKLEKHVLPEAAHTLSVSPEYPIEIARRVSGFRVEHSTVLPFPYSRRDIELARNRSLPAWLPKARYCLSAGRRGEDLHFSIRAFFLAMSRLPSEQQMPVCFVGTTYGNRRDGEKPLEEMAESVGLKIGVTEIPERQSYLDVVAAQAAAGLNCVFGSVDPRYQASKLMPLLAVRRPLLAVLHRSSPAAEFLRSCSPDALCAFDPPEGIEPLARQIEERLCALVKEAEISGIPSELAAFEAEHQASQLAECFRQSLNQCVK